MPPKRISQESRKSKNSGIEYPNKELVKAIRTSDYKTIKKNLKQYPEMNEMYIDMGLTPLIIAIATGVPKIVRTVLKTGASPDTFSRGKMPPIYYALMSNEPEIVKLLEHAGLDLSDRIVPDENEEFITPYAFARKNALGKMADILPNVGYEDDPLSQINIARRDSASGEKTMKLKHL